MTVEVKHTAEGWFFIYGDRQAGSFKYLSQADEVEVAAQLSGLDRQTVEEWRAHPGEDKEKWTVQPKDIFKAKIAVHTYEQEPKPSEAAEAEGPTLEPVSIRLSELSAKLYGKRVILETLISGQSNPKNIPKGAILNCSKCGGYRVDLDAEKNPEGLRNYLFSRQSFEAALKAGDDCKGSRKRVEYSPERVDYAVIFCRDMPGEEKFTEAVYRTIPLHLIGQLPPASKGVHLEGVVTDDYKGDLTVLAYHAEPLEERSAPALSEEDYEAFRRHFRDNPHLREDLDQSIAPLIVGRPEAKLAAALTLHSPLYIRFEGRIIRGCLLTLLLGDTTTGKSRILEWIRDVLRLGEYGTGDMSTYAGLLAAVDVERDIIIWGLLPMADRELALIDSFQKISPLDLPMFREALRSQRLVVRKKVSGEAMCRARILAAANPNKPLDEYVDSAEALLDMRCMTDPVDLTRWDLFIRFRMGDVSKEKISEAKESAPIISIDVLRKHNLWAWSLTPDQIVFTPEAEEAVRRGFLKLAGWAYSHLPLVHMGWKETIARVAAASAVLHHSCYQLTPEQQKKEEGGSNSHEGSPSLESAALVATGVIKVLPEHVAEALLFLESMVDAWEYELFVDRMEEMEKISPEEAAEITRALEADPILKRVFEEIARKRGVEASALESRLNISKSTVIRKAGELKGMDLVESKERRKGYWLTVKGVGYLKHLKEKGVSGPAPGITAPITEGEKVKLVYDKARELAKDRVVSKIAVADALEDRLDRTEVFRLLEKLREDGSLIRRDLEHYVVV